MANLPAQAILALTLLAVTAIIGTNIGLFAPVVTDLAITEAMATPNTVAAGGSTQISVTVKNSGVATLNTPLDKPVVLEVRKFDAPGVGVSLGSETFTALNAGQSRTFYFTYSNAQGPPGPQKILAIVDYTQVVIESDESNNVLPANLFISSSTTSTSTTTTSTTTTTQPGNNTTTTTSTTTTTIAKADYMINSTSITFSPNNPPVNTNVTITVRVINKGNAAGGANSITRIYDATKGFSTAITHLTPSISAGTTYTFSVSYNVTSPNGTRSISARADLNNAISESNENNNEGNRTLTVG